MSDKEVTDLLLVILDINPVWWEHQDANGCGKVFSKCLESVVVFCNSYLLLKHTNHLAFIISHPLESKVIFPLPPIKENEQRRAEPPRDGKYEGFLQLNDLIITEVKDFIDKGRRTALPSPETAGKSLLAGGLAKALCYSQRIARLQLSTKRIDSKILVVKGSPDSSAQYMAVMNCIFAAQKKDVVIDCCSLLSDSGFLQQAADITGGKYLKVDNIDGLLEYLLWVNLPDQTISRSLSLPALSIVDYRAACFCHRKLVETGFVCSVCLSIYCQFRTQCVTCHTRFKLPSLPFVSKGKKKKKE